MLVVLLWGVYYCLAAQVVNDECKSALELSLQAPTACPVKDTALFSQMFTNIGATATMPYPAFTGCNSGGSTTGPAAEVWFTFTAVAIKTQIAVSGLGNPQIVVYENADCSAINPIDCVSGTGSADLTINTLVGNTYYFFVSGGDINDQSDFRLDIRSSNPCDPCLFDDTLHVFPSPEQGPLVPGQIVEFCYTINEWDVTGTIEWPHSVALAFGSGWDLATLEVTPPASCDDQGQWLFLDSWTSTSTGETYGPGFAYDSSLGGPLDGNPGNNWGDGGTNPSDGTACSNIGTSAPPLTFCWSVAVKTNVQQGGDLNLVINPLSDGEAGSWGQIGCNTDAMLTFEPAGITNCGDWEINALSATMDCETVPFGSIVFDASWNESPSAQRYLVLLDEQQEVVLQDTTTSFPWTIDSLSAGTYQLLVDWAENPCGTFALPIRIDQRSTLDSTPQVKLPDLEGCVPQSGLFALTRSQEGSIAWEFFPNLILESVGDSLVEVLFLDVGPYPVHLQVITDCDTFQQSWLVGQDLKEEPVSNFSFTLSDSLKVSFQNESEDGNDPAATYLWDFGDGKQSTDRNPDHQYNEAGNYTVKLRTTNSCGADSLMQSLVLITTSNASFMNPSYSIKLFPNPSDGRFRLEGQGWEGEPEARLRLLNALGQTMAVQRAVLENGTLQEDLDWSHLPAGWYLLQLRAGSRQWQGRLLIQQ